MSLQEDSRDKNASAAVTTCNICGSSDWKDQGSRIGVRCGGCNSLERTRAIKIVLDKLELPKANSKILHFAPEFGLAKRFAEVSPSGYDPVDFSPENFRNLPVRKFDLIADSPKLVSNYYDLIIHSHVMEHIPCNLAYVFFHLSRALKPDGAHVFCLPFMHGHYDEYLGPLPPEEAKRRFGQGDHFRWIGTSDIDRHLGSFMKLKPKYSLSDYADDGTMDRYNIPMRERTGLNGSTIIVAAKSDYLLQ